MEKTEIIKKTSEYVKSKQLGETTGHDWWHTYRVWELAKKIGEIEKVDLFIVELAALLHDLDDWKFSDNEDCSAKPAEVLMDFGVKMDIINQVCEIIKTLSFKGAGVDSSMKTIEGKVVQDADRLDALGAIGIARAFATGAARGRMIYNADVPLAQTSDNFLVKDSVSTLHHFYDKIFLLKDLMNTETAKMMAKERQDYMEQFVKKFIDEWESK